MIRDPVAGQPLDRGPRPPPMMLPTCLERSLHTGAHATLAVTEAVPFAAAGTREDIVRYQTRLIGQRMKRQIPVIKMKLFLA